MLSIYIAFRFILIILQEFSFISIALRSPTVEDTGYFFQVPRLVIVHRFLREGVIATVSLIDVLQIGLIKISEPLSLCCCSYISFSSICLLLHLKHCTTYYKALLLDKLLPQTEYTLEIKSLSRIDN